MVSLRCTDSNFIELLTLSQYQMYNVVGIKVLYLDWRLVISTNTVGYRTTSAFLLFQLKGFFYLHKQKAHQSSDQCAFTLLSLFKFTPVVLAFAVHFSAGWQVSKLTTATRLPNPNVTTAIAVSIVFDHRTLRQGCNLC